jgi:hypothetical protein
VFVFQAVLSSMALVIAAVVLRETPRQRVRFDVAGAVTLSVAIGGAMFALGRVRDLGMGAPSILVACAVAVLGAVAFWRVESRCAEPLLPLAFFRRRNFSAPIVANAFQGAAYMGAFVLAPLILLEVFGLSISAAAGVMLLRTLTLTLSSPLGGVLGYRIGERGAALTGCTIMTAALMVMAWGVVEAALLVVGIGLVLQGMGHGLALPALTSSVASSVPEADLGIASAASRLMGQTGAAFGIVALTLVYAGNNTQGSFGQALLAGAALSALSVPAAFAMGRRSVGSRQLARTE